MSQDAYLEGEDEALASAEQALAGPASRPAPGPKPRPKRKSFQLSFHGKGSEFFMMQVLNALLTMLTLGVYGAWGKVKVRRYMYSQLEFQGERFAYHGTGKELFFGWLKVGVITLVAVAIMVAADWVKSDAVGALLNVVFYGALYLLMPFIIVSARRFALSRSSYQGIRFSFRGSGMEYAKLFWLCALLSCVTLGLAWPIFHARTKAYLVNHSYYGNTPFSYEGDGAGLFKPLLIALVLTPFTLGVSWVWFFASLERYDMANTRFAGLSFASTMTGFALYKRTLVDNLLLLFTLGLAFPWVQLRRVRFRLSWLALSGTLDLESIRQEAQEASALGDVFGDALDFDLGIAL